MGKLVYGVDVYHGSGDIDWAAVYERGARFAIAKATQGIDFVDSRLHEYIAGARAAGLYAGAYCFIRQHESWADQAAKLVKTVGNWSGLLVPVLDLEDLEGEPWTLTRDETVDKALAFIEQIKSMLGRGCLVYTYPSFISEHLTGATNAKKLAGYPLWIASTPKSKSPEGNEPNIPGVWSDWAMWQYRPDGTWPGIDTPGDTDLNVVRWEAVLKQFRVK